ncbi:LppU/SCO3897 family protein [Pseudonocardia sp. GCM10023141]|uniref:LppU/SCO3897 family protein n=1 Tax=Pseudonocardia sp. GCM10023141 TaxID=3252653 RepID=UPI0036062F4B
MPVFAVLLVLGALGGTGWYVMHTEPALAAVGTCVARTGADDITPVGCTDPAATFTVAGRVDDRAMVDAGRFACAGFPNATTSYWKGQPGQLGTVLCLAPTKT